MNRNWGLEHMLKAMRYNYQAFQVVVVRCWGGGESL